MQELTGKIITGVYLSDDDTRIAFTAETGETLTYATEGDCCSESWFSDIIAIHDLLGNQVLRVEEKTSHSQSNQDKEAINVRFDRAST